MPNLLLFSNSTNSGAAYLEHAQAPVAEFLGTVSEVLFIPFALADHDAYTAKVAGALSAHGVRTVGLHTATDPHAAVESAQAIFVGGGNTFRLIKDLQQHGLYQPIKSAVAAGARYMGASAGTNIAAPTIRTTNDMPIVEPRSFVALGLVPFQINPHYLDASPDSGHAGETREDRIGEFLEENDVAVLGLREGTHLRVEGTPGTTGFRATIGGEAVDTSQLPAIVFERGQQRHQPSGDVSSLFGRDYTFDSKQR